MLDTCFIFVIICPYRLAGHSAISKRVTTRVDTTFLDIYRHWLERSIHTPPTVSTLDWALVKLSQGYRVCGTPSGTPTTRNRTYHQRGPSDRCHGDRTNWTKKFINPIIMSMPMPMPIPISIPTNDAWSILCTMPSVVLKSGKLFLWHILLPVQFFSCGVLVKPLFGRIFPATPTDEFKAAVGFPFSHI